MSTDQHPALNAGHDDLPRLTLLLPRRLDKDQTLTGLAEAIGQARTMLAERARLFREMEENCAFHELLRRELFRGQALAGEHAAATIDEAIIGVFGLWDQYTVFDPWPGSDGTQRRDLPISGRERLRIGLWHLRCHLGRLRHRARVAVRVWRRTARVPGGQPAVRTGERP